MRDSEVVASIVAGEPDGLATAYDRYSGALFRYCRSMLHEPDDAADAVQDTFVIAASKLRMLRNPERLRAWLFAVARNECLHRLKSRQAAAPLQDIPEHPDESVDISGEAERAESRALIRAAVSGLNPGERDVITQLWHGLEVPEVAAVLGVSRNHAYSLFARARDQLETSLGVLVVGRSGRADCAALDGLLRGWDGRLTATLRRRVGRHIDRCAICSDRRRRELRPALLFTVTPAALLAAGAARGAASGLTGAARWAAPPPGLRTRVLRTSAAQSPRPAGHAAASAGPHAFGMDGFPRPLRTGHPPLPRLPHQHLAMAGGTAAAAIAVTVVTTAVPGVRGGPPVFTGPVSAPAAGVTATARPAVHPSPGAGIPSAAAQPPPSGGHAPGHGTPRPRPTCSVTASGPSAGPTGHPSPTGPPAPSGTPAPAASPTPPVTVSATPPAPGTLSVSPAVVLLSSQLTGSLTLTASGGAVSWSISEPASLIGLLTVSPSSGCLQAGSSATVQLTVSGLTSLHTRLTVSPGGKKVTVLLGVG